MRIKRWLFLMPGYGNGKFRLSGTATTPFGIDKVIETEFLVGGVTAYRREVLEEFMFDEDYLNGPAPWEDVDFSYRVSRKYRNIYTPYAKAWHYGSSNDRLSSKKYQEMVVINYRYIFGKNIPQSLLLSS